MHVLVTRRLTLRTPTALDADDIALWLNDWDVAKMLGTVPYPCHPSDVRDWIDTHPGGSHGVTYTIHRERLIGMVRIGGHPRPQLRYWLARPWHGQGFMIEAASALLAHAFEARELDMVESSVTVDNRAALRVQERLGFVITGLAEEWSEARSTTVSTLTGRLTAAAFAVRSVGSTLSAA